MKKTALLISTVIIAAGLTTPATASASENKVEAKTTIEYFISLFSPAHRALVVRPKKPKLAL